RLVGHRDRLVAGRGPRRLRPVPRAARPRHVALALEGTGPQRTKVEILADADAGLVVLDRADSGEIVTPSEPRSLGATHQLHQRRLLRLHGPSRQGFERATATIGEPVEQNATNSRDHRGTPAPTLVPV